MFFCVNVSCVTAQTCGRFEAVCFDKNTGKHRSQNSHADPNCSSPLFPRCLVWTREEGSASLPGCRCVLAQAIDFSWALGPCTSGESLSNSICSFTRQSTAAKMLWREHKSYATTCVHGQFNINTASSHPDTLHAGMTKLKNLFIQHVISNMHDMMSTGKVSIDRD